MGEEKTKFKVCKTDLGMDKVYPEGSIVELDENQPWVQKLIRSGNIEHYYDPMEKLLREDEYKIGTEPDESEDDNKSLPAEEVKAAEDEIVHEEKSRNSGRTAKLKGKN